ncbi:hypothetical protein [Enterococcus saccharolyticus]|uniref:Uncharacterized protein n=1 Tax=Enterococcus saccharolyticus subsp. saccharolyticus ATCC 43076 TaxID=1139996 RepID=S0JH95_9ENTE|nr:hypothetical protein [Enterococcus saccharolyticus]EOT27910.1 hypothetical protein OMQ_01824 [Enterococcus saccharolyticus subsp. saccharolyticus ATCC 43076]EOT77288.1 hypothetical protein I572_02200 [Enterococcus saccharolyticus subsp. saccharolyticus ATCC 43076]OJG87396.1 hypothetical protein RV16_GL000678 [Enterococcus saccharolyticus]
MGLFLKEEDFCTYIQTNYPDINIEKGHTIVSVNVVNMQPIMSFAYITRELVIAAKYQRQLQIFTDHVIFRRDQLSGIEYIAKGMNAQLIIHTNEKLPNGMNAILTLNASTMTGNRWHKENLKKMKYTFQQD